MIKGKTPEEIRKLFNIVNDFTPEEEVRSCAAFPMELMLISLRAQAQIKKENVSHLLRCDMERLNQSDISFTGMGGGPLSPQYPCLLYILMSFSSLSPRVLYSLLY